VTTCRSRPIRIAMKTAFTGVSSNVDLIGGSPVIDKGGRTVPPLCLVRSICMCNTSVWLPYRTYAWTAFTMSSSMAGIEK
jgi:hypothetical protein